MTQSSHSPLLPPFDWMLELRRGTQATKAAAKNVEIDKMQEAKEAKQRQEEAQKLPPKIRVPRPKKQPPKKKAAPKARRAQPAPAKRDNVVVGPAVYNMQDLSKNPYLISMRFALLNIPLSS